MAAKIKTMLMPKIHLSCATLQASERTPAPTTAVIICAPAVHKVPASHTRPICKYIMPKCLN